jgi:hypothetical protein
MTMKNWKKYEEQLLGMSLKQAKNWFGNKKLFWLSNHIVWLKIYIDQQDVFGENLAWQHPLHIIRYQSWDVIYERAVVLLSDEVSAEPFNKTTAL